MVTGFKMFQCTNTHNSKIRATFAKLIYKIIIDDIHTPLFAPLSMLRKRATVRAHGMRIPSPENIP
jgi:hypothetical protein